MSKKNVSARKVEQFDAKQFDAANSAADDTANGADDTFADDGLAALSALVRPSAAPPEAEDDADDGKLDLRALAASVPPPAPSAREPEEAPVKVNLAAVAAATTSAAEPVAPKSAVKASSASDELVERPKAARAKPTVDDVETRAAPVARPTGNGNLWIGIGIGAAVAAAAVFFALSREDAAEVGDPIASAPTQVTEAAQEELAPVEEEPAVEAQVEPVAAIAPAPVVAPTEAAALEPTPQAVVPAAQRTAREPAPARARTETTEVTARAPEQAAAPSPVEAPARETARARAEAPAPAPAPSAIDSVLDQALGGRPNREGTQTTPAPAPAPAPAARQAAAPAPAGNLPDSPSRADIARALGRLMPQMRQCAGDQVGMALATILVRGDGSVATVSIGGSPFAGSPQGACMETAIRSAQFSPFAQSTFRVSYPFSIR